MGFSIFKKIMNVSLLACLFFFAAEVAGSENKTPAWLQIKPEDQQALGLKYENVVVKIPGLKREYKFIWISDLHVMAEDVSEIEDKWKAAMIYRRDKHFMNPQSKLNPAAVWKKLPAILNQSNADALFFGGDICDTGSIANQTLLKSGFKQLTKPFIYLKEDHDISPWHLINRDNSRQKEIARETDGYPLAQSIEYDDLSVIGISYSMVHLKADAVARFKELYDQAVKAKKAVLVLVHVAFVPPNLPQFAKKHVWGGALKPTYKTTAAFLNLISAKDTAVKAIFSGHSHLSWNGKLTPTVHQYIFDAAYKGNIGIITIKPE